VSELPAPETTGPAAGPSQGRPSPPGGQRPAQGWSVGDTFTWPVRVYWEDTDAGGIVFYANYLKFFERARTEWLRHLGIGQQMLREKEGGMFIVSETRVQYHRPSRLDDLLLVTARVQEAGRASLTIEQRALLQPPDQGASPLLLCAGSIRIGWVEVHSLRPQRIPAVVLEALKART